MTEERVGKPSSDAEEPLPEKGQSAQRLARTILGAVPVGAVIIDPATHRIDYANRTASGMTGIPEEDLEGSICHELICPAPTGMCPVTDLAQELCNSRKALLRADESHRDVLKTACRIVLDGRERLLEGGRVPRRDWVRVTRPHRNAFLTAPLARAAGGTERCREVVFESREDPDYRAILATFEAVAKLLKENPRMDMLPPGEAGKACAQPSKD